MVSDSVLLGGSSSVTSSTHGTYWLHFSCAAAATWKVLLMSIRENPFVFSCYNPLTAFSIILPVFSVRPTGLSYPVILLSLVNFIQENADITSGISLLLQDLLKVNISRQRNSSSNSSGTLRLKLSSLLPLKICIFREQHAE